ncbi:MAG TPA: SPFH domain-containing protein [Thermomicrobiales bacterium]|nr:SPFH domain-containing protein [Thermomicrobiales bacterium]
MAVDTNVISTSPDAFQLVQVRVPLDDAGDAFAARDASGRIPIVIVPTRPNRIRNDFVAYGVGLLVAAIVASLTFLPGWTSFPGAGIAIVLIVLGVFRSFFVRIPEGTNGLLSRGGRYARTVGSGSHTVPPWITVSHVVTGREIPFDVPVVEAPTRDTVRINVDSLLTFSIQDPYRFVFAISTDDFDHVLQASCQEAMRTFIRRITVSDVFNIARQDTDELRAMIDPDVSPYGVKIEKIKITYAQPPTEFMRSEENRQLAILQLSEQVEKQALAERYQRDTDTLTRQQLLARVQRLQDEYLSELQDAEHRHRVVELEAQAEAIRLERLDERLRAFPEAVRFDVSLARLDVARALAGNSRAVLQIGSADDISQVLLVRDLWVETRTAANGHVQADKPAGEGHDPAPPMLEPAVEATDEINTP